MKINKKHAGLCGLVALLFGVIAWSPPGTENIIVGASNTLVSPDAQSQVIGTGNVARADNSLIVGNSNKVCEGESVDKLAKSLVVGENNTLTGNRGNLFVSGSSNNVNGNSSLIAGTNNFIGDVYGGSAAINSCLIGGNNFVATTHGFAVGYNGTINGDYGVTLGHSNTISNTYGHALGVGLQVSQSYAVAIGKYNATMSSGDVFVVGTGTSSTRNTALKATSDGSVILGSATSGKVVLAKAQGDISMGAYSN